MKPLSTIAAAVSPSATVAADTLAKQMQAAGKDVINLGPGEPDFDTPEPIKESAVTALAAGKTKYTPAAGLPILREAIAARLSADLGLNYAPAQIVAASGAKHSVYLSLRALLNAGDEVVIPAPYWVTYSEAIALTGGTPVVVRCGQDRNFKITPEQLTDAITEKTKLFIINNPCNPTGMLYTEDELRALCDICVAHDLYIMSDEIYCELVYDGVFTSAASLGEAVKERTILINGVSKSYAMTGWRVGYSASNHAIAKIISNYVSHSTGAPATMSQIAAATALTGDQAHVSAMKEAFRARRDYICRRLSAISGIDFLTPQGAFYIMLNIEACLGKTLGGRHIASDGDFTLALLECAQVAVVPGSAFGAPGFIRLSYATGMEKLAEGIDRLEKFLG